MSNPNGTESTTGCATYGGRVDEVRELRAQVRLQAARADRYMQRYNDTAERLWAEQAIVHRIRTLPRYTVATTAGGERVVSAAALDRALGGVR